MDSLYLLVPLSLIAMVGVLALFAWAVQGGQFDDLDTQGEGLLLDADQADVGAPSQQS